MANGRTIAARYHQSAAGARVDSAMIAEPVAITGAACRFPGAPDLDRFWHLLETGGDAVGEVPDGRWSKPHFFHPHVPMPGKSYSWAAGTLGDIAGFDADFFGIAPRQAAEMDPQQRLLLELAWEALADAGLRPSRLAGSETGVYIGASSMDYAFGRTGDPAVGGPHFMTGTALGILANRISHLFDFCGPSLVIDTACSSSLVALDLACRDVAGGRIELALIGGVNLLLSPYPYLGFSQARMLSPQGRCFAFDARADGYVRAEGGGVVVLKRFSQAIADGDAIHAVIRGSDVNQDGATIGLAMPSAAAQARLLRSVYRGYDIAPDAVAFVEAHGTGTPAGDPAEAAALGESLGRHRSAPLPIGSVKTNLGHLEPASGMAGLIKTMLALEHRRLPRSLHCDTPNPRIPFAALNLRVATEPVALPPAGEVIAGVSAFGFGGTNAHAILASAPPGRVAPDRADPQLPPLLISARSAAALRQSARAWSDRLKLAPTGEAAKLIRGQARHRDHHPHRRVLAQGEIFAEGQALAATNAKLVFVFSGNGAVWPGMARDALAQSVPFRHAAEDVDAVLAPLLGWSPLARLEEASPPALDSAAVAQPLLFLIQIAIVSSLRQQGIEPDFCVGHSVGEIAAAWAAGALSPADAALIVATRSRLQERTRGTGVLAALGMAAEAATPVLARIGGLNIAAINSADAVTVAGTEAALCRLADEVGDRALRLLDLAYPFHSAGMDPIRDDILARLRGLVPQACGDRFVSTVTGTVEPGDRLDAGYWWRNIRDPVRFADAIDHLAEVGAGIFVEIGPNPILLSYLRGQFRHRRREGRFLATLTRAPAARDPFLRVAAQCYAAGFDWGAAPLFDGPAVRRGQPSYPWQRTHHWLAATAERMRVTDPIADHPLLGFRRIEDRWQWTNLLDPEIAPWLADHAVDGRAILPAAAYVEIAASVAHARFGEVPTIEIVNLEILHAMPLAAETPREVRVALGDDGGITIASRVRLTQAPMEPHAEGRVSTPGAMTPGIWPTWLGDRVVSAETLYDMAARHGLDYGPAFRPVAAVEISAGAALVRFRDNAPASGYLVDPVQLDGALQGFLALAHEHGYAEVGENLLPFRFGRVRYHAPFGRPAATARLRLDHLGRRAASGTVALFDAAGDTILEIDQCWFRRVVLRPPLDPAKDVYHFALTPRPGRMLPPVKIDLSRCVAAADEIVPRKQGEAAILFNAYLAAAAGADDMPSATAIWRTILADAPEMVGELALAGAAFARPGMVSPPDLVEQMLYDSPTGRQALATLIAAIERWLGDWPAHCPLRVLEIGARRGALTRRLIPALARRVEVGPIYRATDPDPDHIPRLRAAIAGHPGFTACLWDPEQDAPVACPEDGFDLVVSLYGLTRCCRTEAGFAAVKRVAAGATMLTVESVANPLWEMIFDRPVDWGARLETADRREIHFGPVMEGAWPTRLIAFAVPGVRPSAAVARAVGQAVILAPPRLALARHLAVRLEAAGIATRRIDPPATADGASLLKALSEATDSAPAIVLLPPRTAGTTLSGAAEGWLGQALTVARLASEACRDARLYLVTRDAQQPTPAAKGPGPIGAALWGLGRVIAHEMPRLDCRRIDFPGAFRPARIAGHLAQEIADPDAEREIVWTNPGRFVTRLRRGLPPEPAPPAIRLAATRPGRIDGLRWQAVPTPEPGEGQVAIDIRAVGLNFRDVMITLDLLPEEALMDGLAGPDLGFECAGIVTAVGPCVDEVAVGDRVAGFAPAAMASRVVTAASAVACLPRNMDFAVAASAPVAYVTAIYALGTLARLMPGETVLIHGATGGVGIAAIHVARHRGARVIATAGSETKREFLRLLGVAAVFDSRGLAFADDVMTTTDGAGVDVVLNSLGGAAMERSLGLLKPFGRFLELGKRDFYRDSRIGLRPLRRNIAYFGVDIDQMMAMQPDLARQLLNEAMTLLRDGAVPPLPRRTFTFADVAEAFRLMQGAGHIGKIVLCPESQPTPDPVPRRDFIVRADATYLISGGLTGFGLATARWLARRGARHLALVGRRGLETPGIAATLAQFAADGVDVRAIACDIADEAAVASMLDTLRRDRPPLAGIVHAAMVFDDALLADITAAQLAKTLAPKLDGADHLDRLTREDPIDWFVLYGSATTLIGAPGQGAYVAANAALEGVARRRRAEGLPALTIAWGPIADTGTLAQRTDAGAGVARRFAATAMPAAAALELIPALWRSRLDVAAPAIIDWPAARRAMPGLAAPRFADIAAMTPEMTADDPPLNLAGLSADAIVERVIETLRHEIGRILMVDAAKIERHRPLAAIGMDSLMAVELRLALETRLGAKLPLLSISPETDIAALARLVTGALAGEPTDDAVIATVARHEAEETIMAEAGEPTGLA